MWGGLLRAADATDRGEQLHVVVVVVVDDVAEFAPDCMSHAKVRPPFIRQQAALESGRLARASPLVGGLGLGDVKLQL